MEIRTRVLLTSTSIDFARCKQISLELRSNSVYSCEPHEQLLVFLLLLLSLIHYNQIRDRSIRFMEIEVTFNGADDNCQCQNTSISGKLQYKLLELDDRWC